MLKAHQACIDLEKNVLRIQGREVRFLSEHELPDKARDPRGLEEEIASAPAPATGPPSAPAAARGPSFPSSGGRTLGASPAAVRGPGRPSQPAANRHPEEHIRILMDLGVSREVAISTLTAAGGNVDVAASLLF